MTVSKVQKNPWYYEGIISFVMTLSSLFYVRFSTQEHGERDMEKKRRRKTSAGMTARLPDIMRKESSVYMREGHFHIGP